MATIKEVAKLAGLSVSTVSRYLNNHPYISEDKKNRIKEAMEELDYVPSSIATQLRSNKNNTIGVLVSRITNPFFSNLVDSIERNCKNLGYKVLIMQTYDDDKAELDMLNLLKQQVISGIIMCSIEGDISRIASFQKYGHIVLCNEREPNIDIPQIYTNQESMSYEATQYLIDNGYRKIAYCTGGNLVIGGHGSYRTTGFENALKKNQLEMKKEWIFKEVHTIDDGRKIARKICNMSYDERPDAVFTGSDEIAYGLIDEVQIFGLSVPNDLAILGFDNQPYANLLSVPLTTINQPVEELGIESSNLLIGLIENSPYKVNETALQLKLIIRKST